MIIETHVHLNSLQYEEDLNEVITRARNAQVVKMLDIGCDERSLERTLELSAEYEDIYSAVGWHPVDVKTYTEQSLVRIEEILKSDNSKVVALGEIGLDYHWYPEEKAEQIEIFEKQIQLAQKLNYPIIIHCREAYEDCYEICKKYAPLQGVIHSFASDSEMAQKFIDLGFYIGIGGPVTFKNGISQKEVVKAIQLDRLLIETDGPYLTPTPNRGKRNEPAYLQYILDEIVSLRPETAAEIEHQIYENSKNLFFKELNEI